MSPVKPISAANVWEFGNCQIRFGQLLLATKSGQPIMQENRRKFHPLLVASLPAKKAIGM